MYKNILDVIAQIKPEDIDNICVEVSRQLAREGFTMNSLANIQIKVLDTLDQRITYLVKTGLDAPDDIHILGLIIEITIELLLHAIDSTEEIKNV